MVGSSEDPILDFGDKGSFRVQAQTGQGRGRSRDLKTALSPFHKRKGLRNSVPGKVYSLCQGLEVSKWFNVAGSRRARKEWREMGWRSGRRPDHPLQGRLSSLGSLAMRRGGCGSALAERDPVRLQGGKFPLASSDFLGEARQGGL